MSGRNVSNLLLRNMRQPKSGVQPQLLSSSLRYYSAGSAGGARESGIQDSLNKREKVNEDYFIKQHEREQLAHLREQLKKQQKKIDNLEEKLDTLKK